MCTIRPEPEGHRITTAEESQTDELNKCQSKRIKDIQLWATYNYQLPAFNAANKGWILAMMDEVMQKQKEAVEACQ